MAGGDVHSMKIAVIGGGVIGLACARALARRGAAVTLYDQGEIGRGASWVAGGMLAATFEAPEAEPALRALMHESAALWGPFAEVLEAETGCHVGLRREGTLLVSQSAAHLAREQEALAGAGEVIALDGDALRRREPRLEAAGALFAPGDHQVDARALVLALIKACQDAGVVLYAHAPVGHIVFKGARTIGVSVGGETHPADLVVVAAGAWAAALGLEAFSHIAPVKGQILALQMDPAAPLLAHVVWGEGCYLIPRTDGRLVVGASVEPAAGFDARLSEDVLRELRARAVRVLPAAEHLPQTEAWCGFRPGPAHRMPVIGPCGIDGVVGAVGHYRNGILLAPVTVEKLLETLPV